MCYACSRVRYSESLPPPIFCNMRLTGSDVSEIGNVCKIKHCQRHNGPQGWVLITTHTQILFGVFAIDEIPRYRWTPFRWFAHFMPPWTSTIIYSFKNKYVKASDDILLKSIGIGKVPRPFLMYFFNYFTNTKRHQ